MNTFKASRAVLTVAALAGVCGMAATASAQNLTLPSDTDVRAFEAPIDITPGQLVGQGRYARPGLYSGRSVAGSPGFIAVAPGYVADGDR